MGLDLPNPHLSKLETDYLFHLGLDSSMNLEEMFNDVKCVVMCGSSGRAQGFAERLKKELNDTTPLEPVAVTERYHLYKVQAVLYVSHGIGGPSILVMLHEITKLLKYAKATNFVYIRCGTCGGLGVEPGTIIVSDQVYNEGLEPYHELYLAGKREQRPAKFDANLREAILAANQNLPKVLVGHTATTNDFYEAQGRVDGAICDHSEKDREEFLKRCHSMGIRNLEMEGLFLASFCNKVNVPAAMLACTLINRLEGDQVFHSLPEEEVAKASRRPHDMVVAYLKANHICFP